MYLAVLVQCAHEGKGAYHNMQSARNWHGLIQGNPFRLHREHVRTPGVGCAYAAWAIFAWQSLARLVSMRFCGEPWAGWARLKPSV